MMSPQHPPTSYPSSSADYFQHSVSALDYTGYDVHHPTQPISQPSFYDYSSPSSASASQDQAYSVAPTYSSSIAVAPLSYPRQLLQSPRPLLQQILHHASSSAQKPLVSQISSPLPPTSNPTPIAPSPRQANTAPSTPPTLYADSSLSQPQPQQQPQQQQFYLSSAATFQYRSPSPPVSVATSASPHLSDDGSVEIMLHQKHQQQQQQQQQQQLSIQFHGFTPIQIYEQPISPLTEISSQVVPAVRGLSFSQSQPEAQSSPPQPTQKQQQQQQQHQQQQQQQFYQMYVQPQQQLEQLYMPEVPYIPPPPPTGIYVRRAHSDVTDLSSTSTKRTQEESNLTDPPSSSSTTAPHKRIAGRHSVPSPQTRDGKRECMVCKKRFKKLEDHLWTHSPEPKPHKCRAGYTLGRTTCQYVNMGFARVADRNRHELKHYDGRFVCPFGAANCRVGSERFGRLDTFKRHLRIVHGVQTASSSATDNTAVAAQEEDDLSSRAPAGPGRPRRRSRGVKNTASYEKLECSNCSKHYYGVDAFFAHLNECTYALMHPNEADVDSAGVLGQESE